MAETKLDQTWNLDTFFEGGSQSESFAAFVQELKTDIESFISALNTLSLPALPERLNQFADLSKRMRQASAYVSCLTAQDMADKKATQLQGQTQVLSASLNTADLQINQFLSNVPDPEWQNFLATDYGQEVRFPLEEGRLEAKEKLSIDKEKLISQLSVDGYHGWSQLYNTTVGQMGIEVELPDEGKRTVSVGQAANLLSSNNRDVREHVFERWEKAWTDVADFCSASINHIAGFRLNVYEQRGWDQVLKEPLKLNRMSQKTLDTMWEVITDYKSHLVSYLHKKAELLGVDKLTWADVDAPISNVEEKVSYEEACEFIVEQFSSFNPKMGTFAEHALGNRWVEAEDRAGKRPGGFCTSFPMSQESRIFMTFSGTASNISTLAHELGHAYHQHVMNDLNYLNQHYAMNVAETASTFAEQIVSDASIRTAESKERKLQLLEDKLQRAVAFFMNIHARFLFETRFYEERKNGSVSVERLNTLMEEAQKEAFCGELASYHPSFWESKLHFYITYVPFYNFPYTFGYMFSTGIYARAVEEGASFSDKYDALLCDTGSMTVEELALKHLGVNLEQRDFWEQACQQIVKDIDLFLELAE
ncbi:M3 family oligoendopeptidase [Pullulanibacillus sp. KACC 23026]|uniref:M3 family oligoendopeptidase n=1 Tax=Pullulanibacillus sp. KACC 23026 TaxID=3028315 RepID=UPI0023B09E64|nr:M3 family oligoendopeptidase [Pullulanibacillus sp. KACC 23026]WEG12299.1 M3 family oligoendopeptidase [Pullulanibacillus sp. KACC 23026]